MPLLQLPTTTPTSLGTSRCSCLEQSCGEAATAMLTFSFQFFRSITSDSAVFDQHRAKLMNSKKGRLVDASIAQCYIQQIRNAENFIYMENQVYLSMVV